MRVGIGGLLIAAAFTAALAACGPEKDVCEEAIDRWNECAEQAPTGQGVPRLEWEGACNDEALFKTARGDKVVPLRSWSERYLRCWATLPTCLCPGQDFLIPELYAP